MNKIDFEKKYTDVLNTTHLSLIVEEFKKDLNEMVNTEIAETVSDILDSYCFLKH